MKTTSNFRNFFLTATIGLISTVAITSCKDDDPIPAPTPNIVQLAQGDTTLSILVSAVTKAGLGNTLSTTANLTVFAPNNSAFRAAGYPQSRIDALTPAEVTSDLVPLLTYHVLGAKVMAAGVPASDTVKTLNGKNLFASKNPNGVFLNGIKVINPDLNAANGVVHIIESVLKPPTKTIAEIVIADPANFSLLLAAVTRAGLANALLAPGKYTVFAPTNAAFLLTPYNTNDKITAEDAGVIGGIVKAHVIGTNVFASDLIANATANTLNTTPTQQTLTISIPAAVKITSSANPATPVATANIIATNGVIHVIGKVLL